jgi:ABC-type sugar transport system substrate-binding protein
MKKVLAIVIAMVMVFALFACGNGGTTTSPSPSASAPASAAPASEAPATEVPATEEPKSGAADIGFYDPTFDYSSNPRYKIAYMYSGTSVLYDMFSVAFEAWAKNMNIEYNSFSAADADTFLTTLQTYADQGYDGLLVDPDSTTYPATVEALNANNMPWMGCMSPAYDDNGKLLHPSVGFDNYGFGYDMFKWCIDYAKANWADATPENTGGMFIGYSVVPLLELRHTGSQDAWKDAGYPDANYFFLDGVTGDMTTQTGYNLAATTMAANPQIKYWIGCGFFDDYSVGIARAAADAGKADQTVCSTAGGSTLINQWDAGEESSWKSAIFSDQRLYGEPIIGGLYAMVSGQATAETLWPQWVNKGAGETYASLLLPTATITKDMYQDYLSFVDQYTGIDLYPYPETDKTFPVTMDPPASYAG